jgi:cytochrome c553
VVRHEYRLLLRAGGVLLLLVVAVVVTGVYNVSARSGHFGVTAWFLHFAMRQSARTHSAGIEVPELDERDRVIRGATHFAVACAPCHGAPGDRSLNIADFMTPPAPRLGPLIDNWRQRELFWVVERGIKYTGMPAWPTAERPDEVWDVVAFLRVLPRLDATGYRALAFADGAAPLTGGADPAFTAALEECAMCHGYDGLGRAGAEFPVLAGQHEEYLLSSLEAYAEGRRASGTMQLVAARLDETVRERLALYFARQPVPELAPFAADPDRVAEGAVIAAAGIPERGIPDCNHCHGEPPVAENPFIPRLAGQPEWYLEVQLHLWRSGMRGGGPYATLMRQAADRLEPEDISAIAAYYAALPRHPLP